MIELEFQQRPVDIPSDLRLYRRLAMLCISISECCHGKSASFKQLHFINSLLLDKKFFDLYRSSKNTKHIPNILPSSADPYLNRCVNYAVGIGLIEQKKLKNNFKVILSERGNEFVNLLRQQNLISDIFDLCREIGKISENTVRTALKIGN